MTEQIVILDFGSQYTQVIARRIRELSVYSTILPYNTPASEIAEMQPMGILLSGGPASVYSPKAPRTLLFLSWVFRSWASVLGCKPLESF